MRPFRSSRTSMIPAVILTVLAGVAGCSGGDGSPSAPTVSGALLAKAAGGGPSVKSTVPDSAPPDITLDVHVLGSGFDAGSRAVWALKGDTTFATTKVKTNSTRYVSSRELVANITIAADARQDLYDVMVALAGGKNGIGIELFAITSNYGQYTKYTAVFDDAAPYMLRSDNGTAYFDGGPAFDSNCVFSKSSAGFYQLRTIAATEFCKSVRLPAWRWLTLDTGTPLFDFDQDGNVEAIENVPARLLMPDALGKGSTSTSVDLHIMQVNGDGSTEWTSVWRLRYRTPATVTFDGVATTVVEEPASALVDVFRCPCPNHQKPTTTIHLPFRLTLN
jgi:hypothetical protein